MFNLFFISSVPWPCINPQCNLSTLVSVSFKLIHRSSTSFVKVSIAVLIFPYFQFSPHPWSEVTKPTNTMHLWHVLWESDMALVIAHFWIHRLCVTPGDWNNSYLLKWILVWDKMLSERYEYECVHMCLCVCTVCEYLNYKNVCSQWLMLKFSSQANLHKIISFVFFFVFFFKRLAF